MMRDAEASKVLILGGSAQARALAAIIPDAVVRLSAPDRVAQDWPVTVSVGPVTAGWLAGQGVRAVVDASHPFDTAHYFALNRAIKTLDLSHITVRRPGWRPTRRDRWTFVRDAGQGAAILPKGARVFVTTGREDMAVLRSRRGGVFLRVMAPDSGPGAGPGPLSHGRYVTGVGPFSVAQERRLLQRLGIDWLMVRDAGGAGGWPKLAAARALGLPVALIRRPAPPPGRVVPTIEEVLTWLRTI